MLTCSRKGTSLSLCVNPHHHDASSDSNYKSCAVVVGGPSISGMKSTSVQGRIHSVSDNNHGTAYSNVAIRAKVALGCVAQMRTKLLTTKSTKDLNASIWLFETVHQKLPFQSSLTYCPPQSPPQNHSTFPWTTYLN
jgi:hypothetical protein